MSVVTVEIKRQGLLVARWIVTRENEDSVLRAVATVVNSTVYDRLFDKKVEGQL